jgi:hypothetical protein
MTVSEPSIQSTGEVDRHRMEVCETEVRQVENQALPE